MSFSKCIQLLYKYLKIQTSIRSDMNTKFKIDVEYNYEWF